MQIGDRNTTITEEKQVEVLKEYVTDFQSRNSNLYVFNASIHKDEESIHLHLDYIGFATGCKRGLEVQNGLEKALNQQGFRTIDKGHTAQMAWTQNERDNLTRLCRKHDIEITHKHENREHLTKENYLLYNQNQELEKEITDKIDRLENTRSALEAVSKDLDRNRQELERMTNIIRSLPELQKPDGKAIHKGYYTANYVKEMYDDFRSNWLEERQRTGKTREELNKALSTIQKAKNGREQAEWERDLANKERDIAIKIGREIDDDKKRKMALDELMEHGLYEPEHKHQQERTLDINR